jgi:ATP adenylyltransferase
MQKLWSPWRSQYIDSLQDEDKSKCVFCSIIESSNDTENFILGRGKDFTLIMNRYPYNSGHLMVITNRHIANIKELNDGQKSDFLKYVEYAQDILKHTINPDGFNIGLNIGRAAGAGIENHIHFHIVPRWIGDTNFMPVLAEVKVISDEMKNQYVKLKKSMKDLNIILG